MFDMMKKLQEAQQQMQKIKDKLDTITVEGKSPEGKVVVTFTGNRKMKGIRFVDTGILEDREQLEDYLVIAVNDAIGKADQVNEAEMKAAAGSMIPGLGGLFK